MARARTANATEGGAGLPRRSGAYSSSSATGTKRTGYGTDLRITR